MTRPLPRDARRALFVYNLCFPLVFLGLLPGFLTRMFRRGNYRDGFGQRLARYSAETRARFAQSGSVWIHSISVGETLVALKLARVWHEHDPALRVVLSVTTTTGFALAQHSAADWLVVIYNPIDFPRIVRRALEVLRPREIVLIEGEAWPNLVAQAHDRNIPISLVDARLSPRSEQRFRRFRAWTGPIFRLLNAIAVASPPDVERWRGLGISRAQLHVTGSIKFDHAAPSGVSRADEFRELIRALRIPDDAPILVGGSTFPGEEKALAELLPALRTAHPGAFLIIVPRHIERVPQILRDLSPLTLRVALRSRLPDAPSPPDLLLVDTTGELRDWYALATVVFVGKSLTATGGQNPVEPAVLAKTIIFGPHMDNFRGMVEHLLANSAALQVADVGELRTAVLDVLASSERRTQLGTRARAVVAVHEGSTERTVALLRAAATNWPTPGENPCDP